MNLRNATSQCCWYQNKWLSAASETGSQSFIFCRKCEYRHLNRSMWS